MATKQNMTIGVVGLAGVENVLLLEPNNPEAHLELSRILS